MLNRSVALVLSLLIFPIAVQPAAAGDKISFPGLRLDIFGGWAYGKTDQSSYLDADESGEFDNGNLGITVRRPFSDKLHAIGQVELSLLDGEFEADLDFLFLEWRPSDNTSFHLGRSKQPFGIYSEFFDIGTDRPFYDLPQGIYGATEIVAESFDGLAYLGRRELSGGELHWDLYAGNVNFVASEPWEDLATEGIPDLAEIANEGENIDREKTLGLRLEWQARSGFTFGLSAFRGEDSHAGGEQSFGTAVGVGAHAMWDDGIWLLRAEAAHFEESGNLDVDAGYVEAARHFGPHWQAALRWDRSNTTLEEVDLESFGAATLGEHRDIALGANYWLSDKLVIKLSHHWVEGGRLLAGEEALEGEEIELWRFGVQFVY